MTIPIGLVLGVLFAVLQFSGVFESYELMSLDFRFQLRGSESLSEDISLVVVDNQTLKSLGWPVRRGAYASLIGAAAKHDAKALGFDILFTDPGASGAEEDALFADAVRLADSVVFPAEFSVTGNHAGDTIPKSYLDSGLEAQGLDLELDRAAGVIPPVTALAEVSRGMCHLLLDNRDDGVFRRVPLFMQYGGLVYPALGLRVTLDFMGLNLSSARVQEGNLLFGDSDRLMIPLPEDQPASLYLNYKTVGPGIRHLSLLEVLKAYQAELQGRAPEHDLDKFFKGKLVLVGQTAASIGDHGPLPLSTSSPLLLAHASFADNLLTGDFLTRAASWLNLLVILLICGVIGLCAGQLRILPGAGMTAVVLLGWMVAAYLLFAGGDYWIELIAPVSAGLFVFLAATVYNRLVRDSEERLYRQTFERYVAPTILDRILDNPDQIDTMGSTKRLSILFSDIKGYTALSQEISASQVLALLREYLEVMTRVLFVHGGTVDKIMGDGILAFFGDPVPQKDHSHRAVRSALQMQSELNVLQRKWISEGKAGLQIRIGIATGMVYVGNIGAEHHIDYTVIGRTVNLASRLESRSPPGGVLVCRETYDDVKEDYDCEEIPGLELKGYRETYKGYWVFGLKEKLPGETPAKAPQDRRESPRIELVTGIKFHCLGGTFLGRATNASRDGIYIASDEVLPVGTDLTIESQVHAGEELLPVWINGKVRRVNQEGEDRGMGIQFDRIVADHQETIRYFMRDVFGLQAFDEHAITQEDQDGQKLFQYEFARPMEKYLDDPKIDRGEHS